MCTAWYTYIDGCRSNARAQAEAPRRRAVLRAGRPSRRGAGEGGADGADRQGARRPDPASARRRPEKARGQGLRVRAGAAVRPLPAHRVAPPEGPARGRPRGLRAARAVGVLLRHPRLAEGAVRMAELTETKTETEIRGHVRERYAAAAKAGGGSCCCAPD